jgi:Zn-dependent peptidase ImmA (M78 family)
MATKVNANPLMIKWAREDAGFSLDELPKSLSKAEKWENGEEKPTWADLRNLAKKYKRPSFFYFLKEPPAEDNPFIEFRADEKIEEFSSSLRLEIRKAKFRRTAYIKIHEDMGFNLNNFNRLVSNENNPYKLAEHIRNYLNIDFETQQEWISNENGNKDYTHNTFLNNWKEICFDLGILVFEIDQVSETEISGCSIYYDICPIILLNGKNTPNRRIFTLMHELAHLTQGVSAVCDVDKHNQKEAFCNKVAAEIIMPKNTFNESQLFTKKGILKLSSISHMYGVSKQTVVYKLNSINLIDDELKNEIITQIEEKNNEIKQKKKEKNKRSTPKISTSIRKKKYDGEPYTKLVLTAYENNVITSTQAMRYLDTSLDNFDKISKDIWG